MSERSETKPDCWPFEEPLDSQSIIDRARQIHDAGESWPSSVATALIVKRAGLFFTEPRFETFANNPNRGIAVVAYNLSLSPLTKIEPSGKIKTPATSELFATVDRLFPHVEEAPGEPQLKEGDKNELLLKDATGTTILQQLLWLRFISTAATDPDLVQTGVDYEIIEPADLENPEVQRRLPADLVGRVQAIKEYRTIINSVYRPLS